MDDDNLEAIREQKKNELLSDRNGNDSSASASEPVQISGATDLDELVREDDPVLVDFYADWCGPCKMLEPVVAELATETEATVAKVDVDANQQLAAQYGVQGVPTLVLFAEGEVVEKLVGVQNKDDLTRTIEQYT
jgi:thioredoxin 1